MSGQSNGEAIPRDVKEGPTFRSMADVIEAAVQALDDKLEGLPFVIARILELFVIRRQPNHSPRCLARHDGSDPPLLVWFTFDTQAVTLLGISSAA